MPRKKTKKISQLLENFSHKVTQASGTSSAFIIALLVVIIWLITGPVFQFSDTWQLVINTGTTIITFLMVFLIQRTQNKDALAIHIKLNEIVAALEGASNRLIDVEDLDEDELKTLHKHYQRLVEMAKKDIKLTQSHSVEEADARHSFKHSRHKHDKKWGKSEPGEQVRTLKSEPEAVATGRARDDQIEKIAATVKTISARTGSR